METTMRVYLAGPLFTQAERRWNGELADDLRRLQPTLEVVLPQREAVAALEENGMNFKKVFQICLDGISRSDAVVALLDGSDADSGTSFECGYAYAMGKPVLGVRTDFRGSEDRGLNAMLSQSCFDLLYFSSFEEKTQPLARVILERMAQIRKGSKAQ
jgi:nucleoside 2-deoxyribosyltransferase